MARRDPRELVCAACGHVIGPRDGFVYRVIDGREGVWCPGARLGRARAAMETVPRAMPKRQRSAAMRRALALIAVPLCALALGCGSDSDDEASAPAREASSACRLYLRSEGVGVGFRGPGAERACNQWAESHAGGSEFWSREPDGEADGELICAFDRDGLRAAVVDTGAVFSASKAEDACAEFLAAGWREDPGPLAEQERLKRLEQDAAERGQRARERREARLDREWDALGCADIDARLTPAEERRCDELAGASP
jgi:hypothetical protein